MTDRAEAANDLEAKEKAQTRDKVFLTVVAIWGTFVVALWLGLSVHGHDGREIAASIITMIGLITTVVERRLHKNWLYNLGLGLALSGVLIAHGPKIVSTFN